MNFHLLSALKDSTNAIVALEISTASIVAGNRLAKVFFGQEDGSYKLDKLMGDAESKQAFIQEIRDKLATDSEASIEDTIVYGVNGEKIGCDLTFGYVTKEEHHIFVRVRPSNDNKALLLENFIRTRKRPTFTLNVYENFRINLANEEFYKSMACSKDTLLKYYDNQFLNLLDESSRDDYEATIFRALIENPTDILNVPVHTSFGRTLYFYYDMQKLSLVESDWNANLYCALVRKGETLEELNRIGNT